MKIPWHQLSVFVMFLFPFRFFHAAELVGRKIVIHGGWDGSEVFSDLWIFNTDSFVWMQPRSAGFGASARYGHTLTLTPDGRLLVFGGCSLPESGIPKYNDDIRQLDIDTMVWSRPRITGQVPTGRYGHSATLMNDKIFVFGGWGKGGCQSRELIDDARAYTTAILDIKSMSWYVPRKLGHKPAKHTYNHACCRCGPSSVYLFGGFDGRQSLGEFHVINTDTENSSY
jgi:N-acetylneuraminic acid mutarotase